MRIGPATVAKDREQAVCLPKERHGVQVLRGIEDHGRHIALAVLDFLKQAGESVMGIAKRLSISVRTLHRWTRRKAVGLLHPVRLGRPCRELATPERASIMSELKLTHGRIGVETLKHRHPDAARAELRSLKADWVGDQRRRARARTARLKWLVPGTVWSMDFTKPRMNLAGRDRRAFVVRDLASRSTLEAIACIGERSDVVLAVLPRLFEEFGAPLVMKHDNGSAFRSGTVQALLKAFKVVSLPSPPHCPQYNGAVESGMGPLKDFAQAQAATHGHPDLLTAADLENARHAWNQADVRREGEWTTREAVFASRAGIPESARERLLSQSRDRFGTVAKELGLDPDAPMEWWTWGQVVRTSLPDVLVEHGLLMIREGDFER